MNKYQQTQRFLLSKRKLKETLKTKNLIGIKDKVKLKTLKLLRR